MRSYSVVTPIPSLRWREPYAARILAVVPFLRLYLPILKTNIREEITSKSWLESLLLLMRLARRSWSMARRNNTMEPHNLKPISKSLSYVLRHRPDSVGLELEEG